jgi:hypothetical protein
MAYVEGEMPTFYPNNNGFFGGGDGIWAILLFAMIFGWGNGFGGYGNGTASVDASIQRGFDNASVMSKLDSLSTSLNGVNMSLLTGIGDLKAAIASEGCDIRNAIIMQTRDITDAQKASTDAILGYLTQEKIADLQLKNATLQGEISQTQQTNTIINALRGNNCGCQNVQ